MPITKINNANLYWEITGKSGEPMVLVHGSWGDHHNWDNVVNDLSQNFRVLTYDRRGHSKSERPGQQGSAEEDVSDLIALLDYSGFESTHIVGNSGGAAIVLKTAVRRPDLFKTLVVHEPPLFGLLKNISEAQNLLGVVENRIKAVVELIATNEHEQAAKLFVETVAMGPGAWAPLPEAVKQTFIYNAPTFLDEIKDPDDLNFNVEGLSNFDKPALLTTGTQSPPFFPMVINAIAKVVPSADRYTFNGAGHVPHMTHPDVYIETIKKFCSSLQQV